MFKVDIHDEGDTLRVVLSGEFDMTGVPIFRASVHEAGTAWRHLQVELTDVAFMDSTALQALVLADEQARDRGAEMTIFRPSRPVSRLLELTGLEERFAIRR